MSNDAEKKNNFKNKVEGQKAIDALYDAMDKDGLLINPEREAEKLLSRVRKLEHEVDLLKDLLARALKVNDKTVLKG